MAKTNAPARPADAAARLARQGAARPRAEPASGHRLRRALHRAGIHHALPDHRPAGFRASGDRLRAGEAGCVESKSLKLYLASFRNHGAFHEDCTVGDRQAARGAAQAEMAAHRRLLVSARRHADRRVLADRQAAGGRLGAGPGRRALSRARLSRSARAALRSSARRRADQHQHDRRRSSSAGSMPTVREAEAVDDRPDRLPEKEEERVQRHRRAARRRRELGDIAPGCRRAAGRSRSPSTTKVDELRPARRAAARSARAQSADQHAAERSSAAARRAARARARRSANRRCRRARSSRSAGRRSRRASRRCRAAAAPTYGNMPKMKIASRNTAPKQTLARGSAKMPRKLAITAARLNGGGFGQVDVAKRPERQRSTPTSENSPRIANTPRQPNRSPITPAIEAPSTIAGQRDAEQARRSRPDAASIGTRSPTSAIATETRRRPTSPATIRIATSSVKARRERADQRGDAPSPATQTFISRVLPKKSPVTPSTGWISA